MTTTRPRPASPNGSEPSSKKTKTAQKEPTSVEYINNVTPEKLQEYRETYLAATPYRHAVVKDFLSDELVRHYTYDNKVELMISSKELWRRAGHMESGAKKIVYKDGDGNRRKLISTRFAGLSTASREER
jgi:hypothetical protein